MVVERQEQYCPMCGKDVDTSEFRRFGEACCSEAHAEQYVNEVRAGKQAAAGPQERPFSDDTARPPEVRRRRGGCC